MLNLWLRLNKLIRLIRWDKSEVMSIQILWNKYVSILWAMICIWYLWYKVQIFPFFEPMIYIWYLWNKYFLGTMICIWYLWNKYVRTWNNYMGLSLLKTSLLLQKQNKSCLYTEWYWQDKSASVSTHNVTSALNQIATHYIGDYIFMKVIFFSITVSDKLTITEVIITELTITEVTSLWARLYVMI